MTTIIVHGTFASTEDWYWDSWHENGFCQSLSAAMINATGQDDIWRVRGVPVSEIEELNPKRSVWTGRIGQISQKKGHFIWSGDINAISRKLAATEFARYLNVIRDLTGEPIRIIAHSHGCNVVKQASASPKLNPRVQIDRAVFLACPHFVTNEYRQKGSFDLRSKLVGKKYLYQLQPERFGRIANMYSTRDPVVGKLADKLATSSGWNYEVPEVSFIDQDPNATVLYENYEMKVPGHIRGSAVHGWLHSPEMGYTVGLWLETGQL